MWNAATGSSVFCLKGHENWVRAIVFHPGGKLLFSCGDDYTVRVWDLAGRRLVKTIENAHEFFVSCMALSKMGLLATGDVEGTAKLWACK